MMIRKFFGISAAALLLAACGGSGEETAEADGDQEAGPQGEVRGGSITDSMLPVAMVQSQSPQRGGSDNDDADDAADQESDEEGREEGDAD